MSSSAKPLAGVKALLHDVFGTIVDWQGSVHRQLETKCRDDGIDLTGLDLLEATKQWRRGYLRRTREISEGAPGPTNVDDLHRELLDELLQDPQWKLLSSWSDADRDQAVQFWHKLDGWPDSSKGMHTIRRLDPAILQTTLSNGSARLLIDLSRHANLPYDAIFSGDLLKTYKPNPAMYLGGCSLLRCEPHECAMVAAHIYDIRAAKSNGLKTIYVRRATEDVGEDKSLITSIADGGECDVVVDSIEEIVQYLQ
ncbi:hypothetical protein OIO90_000710 [Microbotryomycetes sp. JL221]|nr:hypothetical protein OIO90_000710 [Microbotryomycetes sp. JL221]